MDLSVSRPIRIFALVALIAALGGGGLLVLRPKPAATPPVGSNDLATKPTAPVTHPALTTASKPSSHAKAAAPAGPAHASKAAPKHVPASKPQLAAEAAVAANGLPMALAKALRTHEIVVVSLFDPQSRTDSISFAEARAGAAEARVGFVALSLLDSVAAGALTTALPGGGLLPSPGLLIYRRPHVIVYRIDGFADRDTVAQAAVAARTATPLGG